MIKTILGIFASLFLLYLLLIGIVTSYAVASFLFWE